MTTYILTWNPENWDWVDLPGVVARARAGQPIQERWSSGNTKNIPIGSRVFLLKQGKDPRGIMASGWTSTEVEELPHWDSARRDHGALANYVRFSVDTLLDPTKDEVLDPRDFPPGPARNVYWAPPASGTSIPHAAAVQLEELWAAVSAGVAPIGAADSELSAFEGKVRLRLIRHRSKERALRNAKIRAALKNGSLKCEVPGCGFDFGQRYGVLGAGYAQVHHLNQWGLPMSRSRQRSTIWPWFAPTVM